MHCVAPDSVDLRLQMDGGQSPVQEEFGKRRSGVPIYLQQSFVAAVTARGTDPKNCRFV